MDEVGREAIFLLQSIGLPVDTSSRLVPSEPRALPARPSILSPPAVQDSLVLIHGAGEGDALDATFYLQTEVRRGVSPALGREEGR